MRAGLPVIISRFPSTTQPHGKQTMSKEDTGTIEPLAVKVPEAVRLSGLSQSELYRRAGRGEVLFRKAGAGTVVDYASLKQLVASLPRADIRTRS